MTPIQLRSCVTPTVGARKVSTYTVCGFLGYAIASVVTMFLATAWNLTLGERVVSMIVPPLAFIVVITLATAAKGREWIVFYQATFGVVAAVSAVGSISGGRVWRELDVAVLGIGVFLVFGRIGCLQVACCQTRSASGCACSTVRRRD